jgi:hypothetical protein
MNSREVLVLVSSGGIMNQLSTSRTIDDRSQGAEILTPKRNEGQQRGAPGGIRPLILPFAISRRCGCYSLSKAVDGIRESTTGNARS